MSAHLQLSFFRTLKSFFLLIYFVTLNDDSTVVAADFAVADDDDVIMMMMIDDTGVCINSINGTAAGGCGLPLSSSNLLSGYSATESSRGRSH